VSTTSLSDRRTPSQCSADSLDDEVGCGLLHRDHQQCLDALLGGEKSRGRGLIRLARGARERTMRFGGG
jgi:hypothetical protein